MLGRWETKQASAGAAAGSLGEGVEHRAGQGEGGVGGEHHAEPGFLHRLPEHFEGHRAVIGVGADGAGGDAVELGERMHGVGAADIGSDAHGAVIKSFVAQVADQGGDARLRQFALVHQAGDGERHREHRVAERVFLGTRTGTFGQGDQLIGDQQVGFGIVGHAESLASCVPLAARLIALRQSRPSAAKQDLRAAFRLILHFLEG